MSPATLALTAMFASAAVSSLVAVAILAHWGLLEVCAADAICGPQIARAATLIWILTLPIVQPFLQAFPIALFALVTLASVQVIAAVHECVLAGRCVPRRCGGKKLAFLAGLAAVPLLGPGQTVFQLPPRVMAPPGSQEDCDDEPQDCIDWEKNPANHGPYAKFGTFGSPGSPFSERRRNKIIADNKDRNDGILRSDLDGTILIRPADRNRSGTNIPDNAVDVDHICPRSRLKYRGSNAFSNACVLSHEQNSYVKQAQFPPDRCQPGPGKHWAGK